MYRACQGAFWGIKIARRGGNLRRALNELINYSIPDKGGRVKYDI